jgi:hypothetical protein
MERTRFQRPWRVTVIPGGFRVDNANGLALGYFYWWNSPNSAHQAGVLKRDEAMLMAETFSQMPESDAWRPRRDPPHQPARQLGALFAPAGLLPANLERLARGDPSTEPRRDRVIDPLLYSSLKVRRRSRGLPQAVCDLLSGGAVGPKGAATIGTAIREALPRRAGPRAQVRRGGREAWGFSLTPDQPGGGSPSRAAKARRKLAGRQLREVVAPASSRVSLFSVELPCASRKIERRFPTNVSLKTPSLTAPRRSSSNSCSGK